MKLFVCWLPRANSYFIVTSGLDLIKILINMEVHRIRSIFFENLYIIYELFNGSESSE